MKQLLIMFTIYLFLLNNIYAQLERSGLTPKDYENIDNLVQSLYGSSCQGASVVNVDKSIGNMYVANGKITNPYGTLSGCYIYCALGREINFKTHNGFIGIYKNGNDFWHSDTIICNEWIYEGGFFATRDLNNDGTVEIITSWSSGEDNAPQYMWIFSWDGQNGECINAVDDNGQSVIWADYYEGFEFPDVDGDGILEIQGWREQGEADPVTYSWNGQLYGKWPSTPQPSKGFILPRNKVDEEFRAEVEKIEGSYKYKYIVKIESTSVQDVNQLLVECEIDSVQKYFSRKDWLFRVWNNLLGWTNSSHHSKRNLLLVGETDSSCAYQSSGLPKILYYHVRGYNTDKVSFENLIENSASGFTIGAANPPDPFNATDFLDSLIYYNNMSDSLNWITDPATVDKYNGYFENAKTHLQQSDNSAAIEVLDSVLTDVETDSGITLTSEAYALMKFNVEYLRVYLGKK